MTLERVVRRRQAPSRHCARRHGRQVPLPRRVLCRPHLEVGEVGCAGEDGERYLSLLRAALQVVHHERGRVHVLHVELRLRPRDRQPQVEPRLLRDVDGGGEARPAVDLPVEAGVEDGRVLQGVGKPGFVRTEIDPLRIGAVVGDPELDAEESPSRGSGDVHVDAVAHLEVLHDRRAAVEAQALAALILGGRGLSLQIPARRVGRNGKRRWCRRTGGGTEQKNDRHRKHDSSVDDRHRASPLEPTRPSSDG
jgi:hypothetical protein